MGVRIQLMLLGSAIAFLGAANADAPASLEDLIRQGVERHDAGDYEAAIALYEEALAQEAGNPIALYELAGSYAVIGEHNRCISAAEEGLEGNPPPELEAQLYGMVGSCFSAAGQPKKAIRRFEEGLRRHPDDAGLHLNIAVTLTGRGKYDRAADHLEKAIQAQPGYSSPYYLLGEVHRRQGSRVPSLLLFARFVSLEPNTPRSAAASAAVFELLVSGIEGESEKQVKMSVPVRDGTDDPLGPYELMLSLTAANMHVQEEEQEKGEAQRHVDALVKGLQIFEELGRPEGHGMADLWARTAGPLIRLHAEDHFETLAYLMAARAGLDGAVEWLEQHPDRVSALERALSTAGDR